MLGSTPAKRPIRPTPLKVDRELENFSNTPLRPTALRLNELPTTNSKEDNGNPLQRTSQGGDCCSPRLWNAALARIYHELGSKSQEQDALGSALQYRRLIDAQKMPLGRAPHQAREIYFKGSDNTVESHLNLMLEHILHQGVLVYKFPSSGRAGPPSARRLLLSSAPPQILLARPKMTVIDTKLKSFSISDVELLQMGSNKQLPSTQVFSRCRKFIKEGEEDCTLAICSRKDKTGKGWSINLKMSTPLDRDELANALAVYIDRSRPHYDIARGP